MKRLIAFSIRTAATTIFLALCMTSAHAAEKISFDDLYMRFKGQEVNRSVDVITQDGRTHHTRRSSIAVTQLTLYGPGTETENLPRDTAH